MITTVAGTNVAQTLAEVAETNATPEDNAGDLTASGTLAFDDVEAGDTSRHGSSASRRTSARPVGAGSTDAARDADAGQTAVDGGRRHPVVVPGRETTSTISAPRRYLLTYTIEVTDNRGGVDTQTVTITIEGRTDERDRNGRQRRPGR